MRVLVDIGHPAHVHFFRHSIARLRAQGHEVVLSARDKDVTLELLEAFALEHVPLSSIRGGLWREYPVRLTALVRLIRRFKPDVVTAVGERSSPPPAGSRPPRPSSSPTPNTSPPTAS